MQSRLTSIVMTKDDFAEMPSISNCLPEFKPIALEKSKILSQGKQLVLTYHLPASLKFLNWSLLYTPRRDGIFYSTFFEKCANEDYTLLVIKDTANNVFGAFCTEIWQKSSKFVGDGYSFVFTFRDKDDLELYPASGAFDLYQQSDESGIIVGGSESSKRRCAIRLGNNFSMGNSSESDTYQNASLTN